MCVLMHTKNTRGRLRRFLAVKEFIMLSLVGFNIAFLAAEHFLHLSDDQIHAIEVFDILTALIFISEFLFELHFARDRRHYIKYHWFYLLAAIPIPSQIFEEMRVIRALRLLKLLKIFAHLRYEYNTRLFEKRNFS